MYVCMYVRTVLATAFSYQMWITELKLNCINFIHKDKAFKYHFLLNITVIS